MDPNGGGVERAGSSGVAGKNRALPPATLSNDEKDLGPKIYALAWNGKVHVSLTRAVGRVERTGCSDSDLRADLLH